MTQEDPQVVSKSLWRFLATLSADEWDTTPATAHL
jgi:hypothetical protein